MINNLISKSYASSVRSQINDDRVLDLENYGRTWLDQYKTGTAHISIVGLDGDAVAITSTINT